MAKSKEENSFLVPKVCIFPYGMHNIGGQWSLEEEVNI